MSGIRCFMIEPTDTAVQHLSRYTEAEKKPCPAAPGSGHRATVRLEVPADAPCAHLDDPRMPARCEGCGYVFTEDDKASGSFGSRWRRVDTGEERDGCRQFPPGAMWYADWLTHEGSNRNRGPDGRCLCMMTPGGEWVIDSRCSNCTLPDDDVHRCWVRHGTPPDVTVDKQGVTCNAGAGSIQAGSYHGFLRNGYLTEA